MKWTRIAIFGGVSAGLVLGYAAFQADFTAFVRSTGTYNQISLSETRDDVMYRLGYPRFVYAQVGVDIPYGEAVTDIGDWYRLYDTSGNDPVNKLPDGSSVGDFSVWAYEAAGASTVDVSFTAADQVSTVSCMARTKLYSDSSCPPAYGLRVGDSEADIATRLGAAGTSSLSGVSKSIAYDQLGVTFTLEREAIYRIVRKKPTASLIDNLLVYLAGIGRSN